MEKVLVSWIGHHDFWGMADAVGGVVAAQVQAEIPRDKSRAESAPSGPGPVKTLVDQIPFREVHLISNSSPEIVGAYRQWLGGPVTVHAVSLQAADGTRNPADYRVVFRAASEVLDEVWRGLMPDDELCMHLSPGTPTMTAVSVLLGKTKFPSRLYQTYKGAVNEVDLPFDITVDVVPELLSDSDRTLQFLASRAPGDVAGFQGIVGQSAAIRLAVGRAERAAIRDLNVLLLGESGTGKELFARAIHRASHRGKDDPDYKKFVAVNCAAIPPELFESELFGHLIGSFTNAHRDREGKFEAAHGGTLFLDEVGECSLDNQAKLLRALQSRRNDKPCTCWVTRVGDNEERPFNVRVIAATNRLLLENVASRDFRSDLYYRLATVKVELPALRDRRADIEAIAGDILGRINREFEHTEKIGYRHKTLTPPAIRRLKEHHWPGNVRELTNVLYQAAVMQPEAGITRADVDAAIPKMASVSRADPFSRQRGDGFSLKTRLSQIERAFVEDAMDDSGGNQARAAELLGISQQAVSKKLQKWDSE